MKKYTDTELEVNYNTFIAGLKQIFKGERLEGLLKMYSMDQLGANLMLSPASGNIAYHCAYEGGYIDHIMNVVRNSIKMRDLYESIGGTIDFTTEQLLFSAFHHDLGKLGDIGEMNYIKNTSDWHVKNQGKIFTFNPNLTYMNVTDRAFYLLNKFSIKYDEQEYMGIKLTDGLYEESNKEILKPYTPANNLKYVMPLILHWADHMSTRFEQSIQK